MNAHGLFGVHPIPSDNLIRNLLDTVSPDQFYPVFRYVFKGLELIDQLSAFHTLEGSLLLALDGTEYFSSATGYRLSHRQSRTWPLEDRKCAAGAQEERT